MKKIILIASLFVLVGAGCELEQETERVCLTSHEEVGDIAEETVTVCDAYESSIR